MNAPHILPSVSPPNQLTPIHHGHKHQQTTHYLVTIDDNGLEHWEVRPRRRQVKKACMRCRQTNKKCDDNKPCQRCVDGEWECCEPPPPAPRSYTLRGRRTAGEKRRESSLSPPIHRSARHQSLNPLGQSQNQGRETPPISSAESQSDRNRPVSGDHEGKVTLPPLRKLFPVDPFEEYCSRWKGAYPRWRLESSSQYFKASRRPH